MEIKFSIIVPVYNVEQYLPLCIDSILAQTFTDFEVLLIDDGSTDRSGKICDEYVKQDKRIRVFHKKNGGVSSARNIGIKEARGKWICFVDSDDTITFDYLSVFEKNCKKTIESSLQVTGFNFITPVERKQIIFQEQVFNKNDLYKAVMILQDKGSLGYPWNKIYAASVIKNNHLFFDETLNSYEDELFVLQYIQKVEKIIFCLDATYNYKAGWSANSLSAAFIDIHHHISLAHRLEEEKLKISKIPLYVKSCHENFVYHFTDSICRLYQLKNKSKEQRLYILNVILTEVQTCNCYPILKKQLLKKGILSGAPFFIDWQMKTIQPFIIRLKTFTKIIIKYIVCPVLRS